MTLPYRVRRLFGGRPRLIAECGVYGAPDMIAQLWEGEKFYRYVHRGRLYDAALAA